MTEEMFRGYRAIDEVRANCQRLVDGLVACNKPEAALYLKPNEYDLVARWPKASGVHGFLVDEAGIRFAGHPVKRTSFGKARYEIRATAGASLALPKEG